MFERDQNAPADIYHFTEHGWFQWHTRCIFNNRAFKTHIQLIRHGNRCGNCAVIFSVIDLVSPVTVLPSARRTADLNYRLFLSFLVSLFQRKSLCMVLHEDSFWHRGKSQLGNGLFTCEYKWSGGWNAANFVTTPNRSLHHSFRPQIKPIYFELNCTNRPLNFLVAIMQGSKLTFQSTCKVWQVNTSY